MYYGLSNYDAFQNRAFIPIYATETVSTGPIFNSAGKQLSASEVCGANSACAYDLLVTGDTKLANSTLKNEKAANETNRIFGKFIY